jgi:protein ImuB
MASSLPRPAAGSAPALWAARRYLALFLPHWATDCLKRAEPALGASPRPLALWESQHGALRLVALDQVAQARGVRPGQTVAEARGLLPELETRALDAPRIARRFADFADWHSNASPIVAIPADGAPWGELVLDITGVSHLFGGEAAMLASLVGRLAALGYSVAGGVAATVGAAWALAHFAPGQCLATGAEAETLATLPVEALRLDMAAAGALRQFGLSRIGQLYGRDRRALKARFGAALLTRLDQALGYAEETLTPRQPVAEHSVERRFAEPIGLIEDVLETARDLALALAHRLEAAGLGAQSFHLYVYRVDHQVLTLTVGAARATRDAAHIGRLFSYRAERLGGEYDAGFGIDMIRLAADRLSPAAVQAGAFGSDDGLASLAGLHDRLSSRLGAAAVLRARLANTYVPEQMVVFEPAGAPMPAAAMPLPPLPEAPRPLRLLPQPEPITVIAEVPDAPPARMIWRRVGYSFVRAAGPERLGAEWQHGRGRLALTLDAIEAAGTPETAARYYREGAETRDYYVAEDAGGRRFWLFRLGLSGFTETPRWFLHGVFA